MLKVLLSVFGLLINMVCISSSSSIYDSIFWNLQNPLQEDLHFPISSNNPIQNLAKYCLAKIAKIISTYEVKLVTL